jgi:S-formylglutathione hydrolase FrmB
MVKNMTNIVNKSYNKQLWWFFIIILVCSINGFAQKRTTRPVSTPREPTSKILISRLMAREMPYNIILPPNYYSPSGSRVKFPVLYLLHGLWGSYKDWTTKTKLLEYSAKYNIIIVNPEGGSSWYSNSATKPEDQYESYIIEELIPEIDKEFKTLAEKRGRAIAGLSMGGYGAIKFALKYPDKFIFAASLSGGVAAASWKNESEIPNSLRPSILETFGSVTEKAKIDNDLFKIAAEFPADKINSLPYLYFDCGTEDELGFLPLNVQFAGILVQKKIPHEFRELPGKHSWVLWEQQVQEVLRLSDRFFNGTTTK